MRFCVDNVVVADVVDDPLPEVVEAREGATAQDGAGELAEPALDLVEPGAVLR